MTDLSTARDICEALNRFRWRQLRARHGLAGAALRSIRDYVVEVFFGLRTRFSTPAAMETSKVDVLLLQASPRVIALERKRLLKAAIRKIGYRLEEVALDDPASLLLRGEFFAPPGKVPHRYYLYAAHAEWLVRRYSPRVLLNDRNGSLYSPFLRAALHRHNGLLVHLAHATTLEASRRLEMNDYDYYFLFGRSSLDALVQRPLRLGTSIAVLTGSHMIDHSFDLAVPDRKARVVLVLGVGPDKEKRAGYLRTYRVLTDWACQNPGYRVMFKPHPRSAAGFWQEAAAAMANVSVLPSEVMFAQALAQASVVVNIMSNAVIEAALARRPIIYCNLSEEKDIFSQELFFGPSVTDAGDFQARMKAVQNEFDQYVERSRSFAAFHLAHGFRGLEVTTLALTNLVEHSALICDVERHILPGTC